MTLIPVRQIRRIWTGLAVVALAAAAGSAGHLLAAPQQAPPPDTLSALLVEVRGLRAALEEMASAGPRVQLSVARLQIEEQRINAMTRRLDDIRSNLANAQNELDATQRRRREIESRLPTLSSADPERRQYEQEAALMLLQIADHQRQIQQLTADETEVSQQINTEQTRWTEISQRLDELERALVKK